MPSHKLSDELLSRGYTIKTITLADDTLDAFSSPDGLTTIYRTTTWQYPFISQFVRNVSRDKVASYDLARELGVSTPKTLCTSDLKQASSLLEECRVLIVKPRSERASKGLTRDITTTKQLDEALTRAAGYEGDALVQEQFFGEEIRFTIISGKVCSALMKRKASVSGDGRSTIAELIEHENAERAELPKGAIEYPLLRATMIGQEIDLAVVPRKNEIVELSKSTLVSEGAALYELIDKVDRSYTHIAEQLARALNPEFIVVDLMIQEYTQPAEEHNYVFLEYNTAPVLAMYSSLRSGEPQNVVGQIADLLDRRTQVHHSR